MTADEVAERLRAVFAKNFGLDEEKQAQISNETTLASFKPDSLDRVELVMEIEDKFDIKVPDEDASKLLTFGETIAYVLANLAKMNPPREEAA